MADYYAILKRTITDSRASQPQVRAQVYAKAKAAVERRLRTIVPTPDETLIAKHMADVDQAIDRIESEFNVAPVGGQAAPAPATAPQPGATAASILAASRSTQPQAASAPAPPPQTEPVPAPTIATPAAAQASPAAITAPRPPVPQHEITVPPPPEHIETARQQGDRRFGWMSAVLPVLLGLAVVAAGAYGLWINRERLLGDGSTPMVASDGTNSEDDGAGKVAVKEAGGKAKVEERLGNEGEVTAADAPQDGGTGESEVAATEDEAATADSTGQASTAPVISQTAALYEEGGSISETTADNGSVVWSTIKESPGDGFPPESAIRAQVEIPTRGLVMLMTIKRNVDVSLPASHLIELVFSVPDGFSGGKVEDVRRFLMKSSENARGEPLVAVPAKIDSGLFIIALNNLQQAVDSNLSLMEQSEFVDIPIGYTTGKRAMLTLEKGAQGAKVFGDALNSWKNL